MCLGIPGRVIELSDSEPLAMAVVDFGGVRRRVCVAHVPDTRVGDWVIVHVGFALTKLNEVEADRVISLLNELTEPERAGTS
ncbi:MAG: HypC/HybG/HupF family hydrogenase formation chaperone [Polyangiaceae bacterium]|nr:HypC/HybG/HupF family hydrogenase formation chaperone [Polyangiaceae bacterium]